MEHCLHIGRSCALTSFVSRAAYAATRSDGVGDAARATGNAALSGYEKAKQFEKDNQVVAKMQAIGSGAVAKVRHTCCRIWKVPCDGKISIQRWLTPAASCALVAIGRLRKLMRSIMWSTKLRSTLHCLLQSLATLDVLQHSPVQKINARILACVHAHARTSSRACVGLVAFSNACSAPSRRARAFFLCAWLVSDWRHSCRDQSRGNQ